MNDNDNSVVSKVQDNLGTSFDKYPLEILESNNEDTMKSVITMIEKDVDISDSAKINIDAIQNASNEISEDEIQT